jgi:predicted ATP-dependent endonuclease of OLD family
MNCLQKKNVHSSKERKQMAKGKNTNLSQSSTKAISVIKKNKVAQEALKKQKTKVDNLKIDYKNAVEQYNYFKTRQQEPSLKPVTNTRKVLKQEIIRKGKISQAVTDRGRTASRAEGILNRENKKIK